MSLLYKDELIGKLKRYKELSKTINELDKEKSIIRDQVLRWIELNKIDSKIAIIDNDNNKWEIMLYKKTLKSIRDYEALIKKLGTESSIYIKENTSTILKIT